MDREEFITAVAGRLALAIAASLEQSVGEMRQALADMTRTCLNCEHWAENSEICNLVNQRPPASVIVSGCEKHENREKF